MVPTPELFNCPLDDIASYVDGELSPDEETEFEAHLAGCETCRTELNHQKEFLFALSSSLESENDIPLPKDFTRTIVANAESRVSGLRRPRERFTAIFICAVLFIFALFALGGETGTVLAVIGGVAEKALAVVSFAVRLLFNISYSIAVVARSLFSHLEASWAAGVILVIAGAGAFLIFSRFARSRRTQENQG